MLQKLFGFDPTQNKVRTEIYAGITTFLTMAYILAVNPGIFSALEPYGRLVPRCGGCSCCSCCATCKGVCKVSNNL